MSGVSEVHYGDRQVVTKILEWGRRASGAGFPQNGF